METVRAPELDIRSELDGHPTDQVGDQLHGGVLIVHFELLVDLSESMARSAVVRHPG
jgi:hypothetical protein